MRQGTKQSEKSYKNYLHSAPITPKLRLSIDRRFSFFESVNLVSSKNRAMLSRLSAFVVAARGLATTLHVRRGGRVPRALERSFYKLVAGKTVLEDKAKQFRLAGRGKKMGWGVITLTKIYLARARKCQRQAHAVALTEENGRCTCRTGVGHWDNQRGTGTYQYRVPKLLSSRR